MTCFPYILGTFSLFFFYEIKLYMKSATQVGLSLETFILIIQLYIPVLSLTWRKSVVDATANLAQ